MKFNIPEEYERSSGIYVIRNSVNDKVYVGSTVSFFNRFQGHRSSLRKNYHHSRHLQNFVNKYGLSSLRFELHHLCEGTPEILSKEEQKVLDQFKAGDPKHGYNTLAIVVMRGVTRERPMLICKCCKKEFRQKDSAPQDCCSLSCASKIKGKPRSKRKYGYIECKTCKKPFIAINKTRGYCSHDCYKEVLKTNPHNKGQFKREDIECLICNKEFRPKEEGQKFCSRECYNESGNRVPPPIIEREYKCIVCDTSGKTTHPQQRYCSDTCKVKDVSKFKECLICNKGFYPKKRKQITCGRSCANKAMWIRKKKPIPLDPIPTASGQYLIPFAA